MQYTRKTHGNGWMRGKVTKVLRGWWAALAVTVPLVLCSVPSASAQMRAPYVAPRWRAHARPSNARVQQHVAQAKAQVLLASDISTFQTNLQNLVNWMSTAASNNPQQQAVVNNLQQQINGLTPDQMTQLANNTDVGAFNTSVNTLISTQPTPHTPPQTDPPINLALPNYGVCAETAPGVQPQIPSDTATDKSLLIAVEVLQGAAIAANDLENLNIVIAGEANNLPTVIVGTVIDYILFALETYSDQYQFCDPYDEAAEVRAGYLNTIVIDTDLTNLATGAADQFTAFANQLTAFNSDVDNHISSVAGNTTNQFPQINSQITVLSTNLTNQDNVVNTDIDNHVAIADADLNNHLVGVDADVKNTTTAIDTTIDTRLGQLDTDVLNKDTQVDTSISTLQNLELRLKIEHAMAASLSVESFELPQALGGYLETVRAIVADTISKMLAAGQAVGTATKSLALGDTALNSKQYKSAYQNYATAYQIAVK